MGTKNYKVCPNRQIRYTYLYWCRTAEQQIKDTVSLKGTEIMEMEKELQYILKIFIPAQKWSKRILWYCSHHLCWINRGIHNLLVSSISCPTKKKLWMMPLKNKCRYFKRQEAVVAKTLMILLGHNTCQTWVFYNINDLFFWQFLIQKVAEGTEGSVLFVWY